MPPSVLMFCPQFRPAIGGAERQAEKLAEKLIQAGYRVAIVTPRVDPDSPDREEVGGLVVERFPLRDLSRSCHVPCVGLLNLFYILWQVGRAVRARLKGVQILHCHMGSLETLGAALAGYTMGVPVLCKAATADERSDLGKIENTGSTGRLVAWMMRRAIGTWVATTAPVVEALVRAGVSPDGIKRIPNGVALSDIRQLASPARQVRHFLYLGRLSMTADRDVPTLIRAFARLAATHPDIELAIVGAGDLFEETKQLIAACGVPQRIVTPGFDQPEKWLAWADCFVLPSRREGLSNALLEAMAAGLPCIANDIPPNREVLAGGRAGVLVPVEDCDALHAVMQAMVVDESMARSFAVSAKQRVEQFYSIESVASRYGRLYRTLAAPRAQTGAGPLHCWSGMDLPLRPLKTVLRKETARDDFADPEMLEDIARCYPETDARRQSQLEEQFSLALHNTRMGGVFKRTNPRRLPKTEQVIATIVPPEYRSHCRILDVGASDGITSVELLEYLQARWGRGVSVVASDLNLWLERYRLGLLLEYREPSGEQVLIRIGRWGFRPARLRLSQPEEGEGPYRTRVFGKRLYWQFWNRISPWMRFNGRISLINPRAKAAAGIETCVLDCLTRVPTFTGAFNLIRASNVLNAEYFEREEIFVALSHMHGYLTERGGLVLSRNDGKPGDESENGTAWIKSGDRFIAQLDFGGGSEIKEIVDLFRASGS